MRVRVDTNRPTELFRRPPDEFGPFDVYEQIGQGGLASVHEAVDRHAERCGLARPLALERLRPQFAGDWELVTAFMSAAHITSQLAHGNIARTHAYGRIDGTHYCATELVEGPTLEEIMRQSATAAGAIPVPVVIELLVQLCDALAYLHARDVPLVLAELAPSSLVLAPSGALKLVDIRLGKPGLDPRDNLRAVGMLAHELLIGKRVRGRRRGPPSRWNAHVSADLDDIVKLALERDVSARWQNAAAMRFALRAVAVAEGGGGAQNALDWTAWAFGRKPRRDSTKVRRLVDALDHELRAAG